MNNYRIVLSKLLGGFLDICRSNFNRVFILAYATGRFLTQVCLKHQINHGVTQAAILQLNTSIPMDL